MLHENGVTGPLVPATAEPQRVLLVLGMPNDVGYTNSPHWGMVGHRRLRSIFAILLMPPCSNWYGQKNFGKPNAEIEQIQVDQNRLVCYNKVCYKKHAVTLT
jgi:hypothetical protein